MTENLEPNFNSIVVTKMSMPFRDEPYYKFTYSDPILEGYEVIVVEDSLPKDYKAEDRDPLDPNRLVTMITRFPRCVLAEVNTHRVFSRNSASSRARSVKATIAEVMNAPYIPLFTVNQRGMAGRYMTPEKRAIAEKKWLRGRDRAVVTELELLLGGIPEGEGKSNQEIAENWEYYIDSYYENGYTGDGSENDILSTHKQNANRVIEPYMWHEAIITSSYWDNYLELRDEKDAQPEIIAMAKLVRAALNVSEPEHKALHLPFVDPDLVPEKIESVTEILPLLFVSATECAKVSYKDRSREQKFVLDSSIALGKKLFASKHFSPFEHVAFDVSEYLAVNDPTTSSDVELFRSNLHPVWVQLRHVLSNMEFSLDD